MDTPTDDQRVNTAIAQLYETLQPQLLCHLTRLVENRETAEDLCHETFIKALRGWNQHDSRASAAAWLYRIATNTAYDYLRRRQRIRFSPLDALSETPSAAPRPDAGCEGEPVRHALACVPPQYRVPLVLHACAGHSMKEIAAQLGCTDKAAKTRVYRGRLRFREAYHE